MNWKEEGEKSLFTFVWDKSLHSDSIIIAKIDMIWNLKEGFDMEMFTEWSMCIVRTSCNECANLEVENFEQCAMPQTPKWVEWKCEDKMSFIVNELCLRSFLRVEMTHVSEIINC